MECRASDYFEVVSTDGQILYFEVKGFWSDTVVDQIEEDAFSCWKTAVDSYQGQKFVSMPNMTNFKVARDKGKALIGRMMKYAQEHNLHHSVQIMPEAMARIVISEPVKKVGHKEFRSVAHTLEEAQKIAAEKLKEIQ